MKKFLQAGFLRFLRKGSIGRRLVIATVLFSFSITLAASGFRLYTDYRKDISTIEKNFVLIEDTYIESLSTSLWRYDQKQIQALLDGLSKLPDIEFIQVKTLENTIWFSGAVRSKRIATKSYPITFYYKDETLPIGTLTATASLDNVYGRVINKAVSIFITNAILAFLFSGFIFLIFHLFVTRHLIQLAEQVEIIDIKELLKTINLEKKTSPKNPDEIDRLVNAFNFARNKLHQSYRSLQKNEETLKLSHERFLTVVDSIDAAVYVADIQTFEILFMNRFMKESYGADLTGQICWEAFRGEKDQCPDCTNDKLIDENGNPSESCVWQGKNSVTGRWYINHDRAIRWTDKRVVRLQVATDVTEFRQMESQLRQAQKMEAIGTLAGGVAHDFNNMLSIILGHSEMMSEDLAKNDPASEHLKEIIRAAERSANLTKQLLAFARKQTISPEVLDINQTINKMIKMLERLIGEDIELSWLPGDDLWRVKMDPSQIDQIMANLSVNARDAIKDIGKVTIETANASFDKEYCQSHSGCNPGDYIMMAVSDNGCGMDPDVQEKLFEPFFTTKGTGRGTGLGLSTVHGIIMQNNGFINVYSEPDQGTTFRIYLPRHMPNDSSIKSDSEQEDIRGGRETILLVEDEKSILAMTSKMIKRLGYSVIEASDPEKAIQIAQQPSAEFDLLLTDVIMPQMNGRDLCRKLLELHPELKCLYMSGYTADVIAHHGVLEKDMLYIQKPFSKQDLAKKIRRALDRVQAV